MPQSVTCLWERQLRQAAARLQVPRAWSWGQEHCARRPRGDSLRRRASGGAHAAECHARRIRRHGLEHVPLRASLAGEVRVLLVFEVRAEVPDLLSLFCTFVLAKQVNCAPPVAAGPHVRRSSLQHAPLSW